MSSVRHISDELPMLLTGDATRDVVMEAASHLRVCVDCQQELVSAVIAHASLTSAHRFAPEIVASDSPAIEEQTEADLAVVTPLPDMSRLFADVRADSPGQLGGAGKPRRVRSGLVAVAAAAAVVVGGGVTYSAISSGNDTAVTRTVALEGVTDASDGSMRLVGSRMVIDAAKLPAPKSGHQYEVWLTDDEDKRQPIGYLRNGAAEISVPGNVMDKYKGIAVSVQRNGQTEFSGEVVLSGTYG